MIMVEKNIGVPTSLDALRMISSLVPVCPFPPRPADRHQQRRRLAGAHRQVSVYPSPSSV
jgi:hypothetical protein